MDWSRDRNIEPQTQVCESGNSEELGYARTGPGIRPWSSSAIAPRKHALGYYTGIIDGRELPYTLLSF
jgi:hypothetical protein